MKPFLNCLFLKSLPILQQLKLEEALLRTSSANYCIINQGTEPAIVMGISGKEEAHIERKEWILDPLPIIRRFSGGGTVVVDENTFFITFLFNGDDIEVPCRIDAIHLYLEQFWQKVFYPHALHLRENDYVLGEKKTGGNAQYLTKKRWLHHTSFLWDFAPKKMALLSYPSKTPSYRKGRSHLDFLTTISNCFTSRENFKDAIHRELRELFSIKECSWEECTSFLKLPHRQQTTEVKPFF